MSKKREQALLEKSLDIFVRILAPKRIYLFGSRAKREAQKASDFDFALDCDIPDMSKKREVRDLIEQVAGLYTVDIIYWKEADAGFRDLILKTGKILYEQK